VVDVPLELATDQSLKGYGRIIHSKDEISVSNGNFEIKPWPVQGWRKLDPGTGDEAGTTEGEFELWWDGDNYRSQNKAVITTNNTYLGGFGVHPDQLSGTSTDSIKEEAGPTKEIYLWMSDYHPDGGQLFWPCTSRSIIQRDMPFVVCLGKNTYGDDIRPEYMRAFLVPAGKGVYFHPGTWHNEVYIDKKFSPATFFTRQGKVHARVSVNWATEFGAVLRVPMYM